MTSSRAADIFTTDPLFMLLQDSPQLIRVSALLVGVKLNKLLAVLILLMYSKL